MGTPFLMPSLSPTMTEGGIVAWRKQEGEAVQAGEILVEIETDKAIMEVEAPSDGVLDRILQPAGDGLVAVGTPIAVMRGADEAPAPAGLAAVSAAAAETAPPLAAAGAPAAPAGARKAVTPVARRRAAELGVDAYVLAGSGPGGRVVKADVEAAARGRAAGAPPAPAIPAPAPAAAAQTPAPSSAGMPAPAAAAAPAAGTRQPHSGIRRTIAARLQQSKQSIPHFYLTVDCQIDGIVQWKDELAAEGLKLTLNDFVVAACAKALKRVPQANATWTDDAMILHDDADISVAVATPNGLITPILFQAQNRGLQELSSEMRALAQAARQGRLAPHQYQGGTFSVSNLGKWGIREFAAIINPPQACILAVGAADQRPVARDGAIVAATVMTCTLSADHRVIDGAAAAEFLADVRRSLERPLTMLL